MNLLKSFFMMINEILLLNLLTILYVFMGFSFKGSAVMSYQIILIISSVISLLFFVLNVFLNLKYESILKLRFKAFSYFIVMFALYSTAFALSQQDPQSFMFYAWGNLPVFVFLQMILPSEYNLWIQFGLSLFFVLPILAIKLSDGFSQFIHIRLNRTLAK